MVIPLVGSLPLQTDGDTFDPWCVVGWPLGGTENMTVYNPKALLAQGAGAGCKTFPE